MTCVCAQRKNIYILISLCSLCDEDACNLICAFWHARFFLIRTKDLLTTCVPASEWKCTTEWNLVHNSAATTTTTIIMIYFFNIYTDIFFGSRLAARNPWGLTQWHLDIFFDAHIYIYSFLMRAGYFFDAFIFFDTCLRQQEAAACQGDRRARSAASRGRGRARDQLDGRLGQYPCGCNIHPSAQASVPIGLRCGIIVVARIRRNFCEYRMWTGAVHGRTD